MTSVSQCARAAAVGVGVMLTTLLASASPVLAVRPAPFCPTAFTSGSVTTLAGLLTGFATPEQVQALDRNGNGQLCWLHIPGVGYNILDDGTPR